MLGRVERLGRQLGSNLARRWESLADGWRDLMSRSANALTRFTHKGGGGAQGAEVIPADAPRWSLLAGDVVDAGSEIIVRLEMPGISKDDCEVLVENDTLYVRGEKRADATFVGGFYHVRQCAYGAFERVLPLPRRVQAERADVQLRNGVLVVRLPKASAEAPRRVAVA